MSSAKQAKPARGARELARTIIDSTAKATVRTAAIKAATAIATSKPSVMKSLLRTVADAASPISVRRAALGALKTNRFKNASFAPLQPEFLDCLRAIATDPDEELRRSALESLAASGDEYGQRLLTDGLRDPAVALVDPASAIGMIGVDSHAHDFELMRKLAASDDKEVRRSALRVLVVDSGSVRLFKRIAQDKDEDREARATSAIALQSLSPRTFKKVAEKVAFDDGDYPEIRTTVVNALVHDADFKASANLRSKAKAFDEAPAQVRNAALSAAERER